PRHSHFDQTHPAIPRRAQFLVVAIARYVSAGFRARFDYACAFRKLMPLAIDLNVEHLRRAGRLFGHIKSPIRRRLFPSPDRGRGDWLGFVRARLILEALFQAATEAELISER